MPMTGRASPVEGMLRVSIRASNVPQVPLGEQAERGDARAGKLLGGNRLPLQCSRRISSLRWLYEAARTFLDTPARGTVHCFAELFRGPNSCFSLAIMSDIWPAK